jgi:hypothetical protein
LELHRPDHALEIITTKLHREDDRPHLVDTNAMAQALTGDVPAANEIWEPRLGSHDAAFKRFISGRSIAVVGPARPLEDNGAEIDSFDVVVRTNYRPGSNHPEEFYGSRTDVSYYNHQRISTILEQVTAASRGLEWVVLKGSWDESTVRNAGAGSRGVRTLFAANTLFFNAFPMAMQNVLHDLIRFSPKSIKLFSTSFYSSADAYGSKNYRTLPFKIGTTSSDLRFHEPFSNYSFIINLHRAGLCALDTVTTSALALGRERYAESIDDIYGEFTLPLKERA